jgi:formylmethanofuran dehydrogenase subunit E
MKKRNEYEETDSNTEWVKCKECGKMVKRDTLWFIADGMCCEDCYEKTIERRREKDKHYEELGDFWEDNVCRECGVMTEDIKSFRGIKVCERCYRDLDAARWLNNALREIRNEDKGKK